MDGIEREVAKYKLHLARLYVRLDNILLRSLKKFAAERALEISKLHDGPRGRRITQKRIIIGRSLYHALGDRGYLGCYCRGLNARRRRRRFVRIKHGSCDQDACDQDRPGYDICALSSARGRDFFVKRCIAILFHSVVILLILARVCQIAASTALPTRVKCPKISRKDSRMPTAKYGIFFSRQNASTRGAACPRRLRGMAGKRWCSI